MYTQGENGAPMVSSLGDSLIEIFSKSLTRGSSPKLILSDSAEKQEITNAVVLAFYARSIKNGAGERDIFYQMFGDLFIKFPKLMVQTLKYVSDPQTGGSWNDFNRMIGYFSEFHPCKFELGRNIEVLIDEIVDIYSTQLMSDSQFCNLGKMSISLAAKYAPSEGTRFWRIFGIRLAQSLYKKMNPESTLLLSSVAYKHYRNLLSKLRRHLEIVEVKMCSGRWSEIDFSRVPSNAMYIYGKRAFPNLTLGEEPEIRSSDKDRILCAEKFEKHKDKATIGEAKIHGSTVGLHQYGRRFEEATREDDLLELQFNDLIFNLRLNSKGNIDITKLIPLVDVSGSMNFEVCPGVSAMSIAIQLGLIFSELNDNPSFAHRVLTFSSAPVAIDLSEFSSYHEKYNAIKCSQWDMNTNFEAVFDLILQSSIKSKIPKNGLKDFKIIVFSDMQFDAAGTRPWNALHEEMTLRFNAKGYDLPGIIYWNLASRPTEGFVVEDSHSGVVMVSGFGIGQFKSLLKGDLHTTTPYEKMMEVLSNPVFDPIRKTVNENFELI